MKTSSRDTAPGYAEIGITTNFSFLRGGSHPQIMCTGEPACACLHRRRRSQYTRRHRAGL